MDKNATTDLFNLAVSTMDSSYSTMTKEEFIDSVLPPLQRILDRTFPENAAKRKIKIYKDRISFAAPCCGDSAVKSSKKRGNIILEGKFKNMYKCFNCGTCMTVVNFFKRYGESLSISSIDYITSTSNDVSSYYKQTTERSISHLYNSELIEDCAVDRDVFRSLLGLEECTQQNKGRTYLINRRQYDFSKFMYSSKANKLFILNLTPSGKIFGLQVRRFDNSDAKYKTYNIQKIHEIILKDNVKVPDDIVELSMIFNILNVDITKVVSVLEGPMDSFLVKNGIALCGASKSIEFPFQHRFIFDSDETGKKHAIDKLSSGYSVFMWDRFLKDIGAEFKPKWDINDIVIWAEKNHVKLPNFDLYFTNDRLDIVYL